MGYLDTKAWVKDPLKVHDRPMDFFVTKYKKFIAMISESTLQLTLKNTTAYQVSM